MRKSEFRNRLLARLHKHGLPASLLERNVAEIGDHFDDLVAAELEGGRPIEEAEEEAASRLGRSEELAARIISSRRNSCFSGRHPVLVFFFLPILLAPVLMCVALLPPYFAHEAFHLRFDRIPPAGAAMMNVLLSLLVYSVVGLASGWICSLAWKAGLGRKWLIGVWGWCALLALLRTMEANFVDRRILVGFKFPWQFDREICLLLLIHILLIWPFFKIFGRHPAPDQGALTA